MYQKNMKSFLETLIFQTFPKALNTSHPARGVAPGRCQTLYLLNYIWGISYWKQILAEIICRNSVKIAEIYLTQNLSLPTLMSAEIYIQ